MQYKTRKIGAIFLTLATLSQSLNAASFFDFRNDLNKRSYISGQIGYVLTPSFENTSNNSRFPLGLSGAFGQNFRINDRIFLGYESGVKYLGKSSYSYQGKDYSQNKFAIDALATVSVFFNPYLEIHAKIGPYYGFTQGNSMSTNSVNLMMSAGAGLYVNNSTEMTLNLNYFNGGNDVEKVQRSTSLNLGVNFYF